MSCGRKLFLLLLMILGSGAVKAECVSYHLKVKDPVPGGTVSATMIAEGTFEDCAAQVRNARLAVRRIGAGGGFVRGSERPSFDGTTFEFTVTGAQLVTGDEVYIVSSAGTMCSAVAGPAPCTRNETFAQVLPMVENVQRNVFIQHSPDQLRLSVATQSPVKVQVLRPDGFPKYDPPFQQVNCAPAYPYACPPFAMPVPVNSLSDKDQIVIIVGEAPTKEYKVTVGATLTITAKGTSGGSDTAPPAPAAAAASAAPVMAAAASGCEAPYLPKAPNPGGGVTAIFGCVPASNQADVKLLVNGKEQQAVWSEVSLNPLTFSGKPAADLKAGDTVAVFQTGQREPASPTMTVASRPDKPKTIYQVKEGDSSISGSDKSLDKVKVQVVESNSVVEEHEQDVDPKTGLFTAKLDAAVNPDQTVKVFGESNDLTSEAAAQVAVVPAELDWGRVTAKFTGGVLMAADANSFSSTSASPFLSLDVDKNWMRPFQGKMQRYRFDTFFNARLTSIATTSSTSSSPGTAPTTTTTTGFSPSMREHALDAGTTSTGSSTSSNPVTNALLDRQAASLQIGAYLPLIISNWYYRGVPYSLYVAPLVKAGFYTLDESTSETSATLNATVSTLNNASFYKFYGYGARVGHYREYRNWDGSGKTDRAPEQLTYLDFLVGKWGNFENVLPLGTDPVTGASCGIAVSSVGSGNCLIRDRTWRVGFEGFLKIPYTPFILGLSANVASPWDRIHRPGFISPPDDLRFLFGARFDARKLFDSVTSLGFPGGK